MKFFRHSLSKLITVFLIGLVVVGGFLYTLFLPVNRSSDETTRFVVSKGQGVSSIAMDLKEDSLVRNALIFRLVVKLNGLESKIQAGSFELAQSMSPRQIAIKLTEGTNDIWITIPEGWRREEIAESIAQQELELFDPEEFLDLSAASEGTLFPDSYLVPKQTSSSQIYNLLTNTFDRKVTRGLEKEISSSPYSFDQVLIMASLVEREARGAQQMRRVAGILWNRVDIGMALQVDATLQYVKGYSRTQTSWWVPPTSADKKLSSPFNTYLNPGLPPRPISNPGLDAIRAALDPLESDDLFYLHDRQGNIYYSQTLEEHQQNINLYLL